MTYFRTRSNEGDEQPAFSKRSDIAIIHFVKPVAIAPIVLIEGSIRNNELGPYNRPAARNDVL